MEDLELGWHHIVVTKMNKKEKEKKEKSAPKLGTKTKMVKESIICRSRK